MKNQIGYKWLTPLVNHSSIHFIYFSSGRCGDKLSEWAVTSECWWSGLINFIYFSSERYGDKLSEWVVTNECWWSGLINEWMQVKLRLIWIWTVIRPFKRLTLLRLNSNSSYKPLKTQNHKHYKDSPDPVE